MDDYFICLKDICQKESDFVKYLLLASKGKLERYYPIKVGVTLNGQGQLYDSIHFLRVRKPVLQPYVTNLEYLMPTGMWLDAQAQQMLFQGVKKIFKQNLTVIFQKIWGLKKTNIRDLHFDFKSASPTTKDLILKVIKLYEDAFRRATHPNFHVNTAIMHMIEIITNDAYPSETQIKTLYENDFDLSEIYKNYGSTGFTLESTQNIATRISEKSLYIKHYDVIKQDENDVLEFCSSSSIPLVETGRRFHYVQFDPLHEYRNIFQEIHDILKFKTTVSVQDTERISQKKLPSQSEEAHSHIWAICKIDYASYKIRKQTDVFDFYRRIQEKIDQNETANKKLYLHTNFFYTKDKKTQRTRRKKLYGLDFIKPIVTEFWNQKLNHS